MSTVKSYLNSRRPHFSEREEPPVHIANMNGRHYYAFASHIKPPGGGKHVEHDELIEVAKHSLVIQAVKHEAKRRIEVIAPLWKQCNALADLVQLQNKKQLTDDEQARLIEAQQLFDKINTIRKRSNVIENALLNGVKVDPINNRIWVDNVVDVTNDINEITNKDDVSDDGNGA